MPASKIWFITGASRGFGRIWAEAILQRGDNVVATARNVASLAGLAETYGDAVLTLPLDVTDEQAVIKIVNQAHTHFGRLDVILSNAGYGVVGALEEVNMADARANFETNVIGTLSIIKAAMPLLRAQGSGHFLPISSISGLIPFPLAGIYQATKFAIEGLCQALALETERFGIKVTIIEPGPFTTDFTSSTSQVKSPPIAVYDPLRKDLAKIFAPEYFGDPAATSQALFQVVDSSDPPRQLLLGSVLPAIRKVYEERLAGWEKWDSVAVAAQGRPA